MSKKPRKPTKKELAEKRAAFDRVLAAANAERTDMISLYDIAIWLLYACTRSDAIHNILEHDQDDEDESEWTVRDECDDAIDLALDDSDAARQHELDVKTVGEELDPDFDKPVHELTDWLK